MEIGIIGAKLQGVEAAYLARKRKWTPIIFGNGPSAQCPGAGMGIHYHNIDPDEGKPTKWLLEKHLRRTGLIVAATEDEALLKQLKPLSEKLGVPLAFDGAAYEISSSKKTSDKLFRSIGVPTPRRWPHCGYPVLMKPVNGSGGVGVKVLKNEVQMAAHRLKEGPISEDKWVMQEFLPGPSHSLEIVGVPGNYVPLLVTDLEMDERFDCKRVTAPTMLSSSLIRKFEQIAIAIAEKIQLKGIMDVEAILYNGTLKVLEIDARLPSQTPTVVYHSMGVNILEAMAACAGDKCNLDKIKQQKREAARNYNAVIYEHIKVNKGVIDCMGEGIMTTSGPLHHRKNFFGADEAITSCHPLTKRWVAAALFTASTMKEAEEKRETMMRNVVASMGKEREFDSIEDR